MFVSCCQVQFDRLIIFKGLKERLELSVSMDNSDGISILVVNPEDFIKSCIKGVLLVSNWFDPLTRSIE